MPPAIAPPHVRCPDCGAEATLLPDGAIYCPAENAIAQRFAPDAPQPGGNTVHRRHHIELDVAAARAATRDYGVVNMGLFVFVAAALIAALAGLALLV